MTPPVAVIDTNILVSGVITTDAASPVCRIVDTMLSAGIIYLISADLLDEYREVLLRPKIRALHKLSESNVDTLLMELVANGLWREPGETEISPDPNDSHLWRLLAAQRGSVLVTGDRLLLANPPVFASVIAPATYVKEFL